MSLFLWRPMVDAPRSMPAWWGGCDGGWCGGAFLCDRHAGMLPAFEAWLLGPETAVEAPGASPGTIGRPDVAVAGDGK